MPYKYKTIKDLIAAFADAQMPISEAWVYRQEQKGNLKLPRSTTNFKKTQGTRKQGAVRVFTTEQISDIVSSFLPGGRGFWSYE
jgi:hypothetical protein